MTQIPLKYFKCVVSENLVLTWLVLYSSQVKQFSVTLNKALSWKLTSCSISFRTQHSEGCSGVGLSFVVLCNTNTASSQTAETEPTSVLPCVYFSSLLHKKQCCCFHLSRAPQHVHWKVLREVYTINSIQFKFCTEIIMLDILNSMLVSYIMQGKYTNNWPRSNCSCNKGSLFEFPVKLNVLSQHNFI